MERWADKVAIVTGASSGIGNAISKELVKQGMKVAALARRIDRLEELEEEVNKKGYIKGIKCDVAKEEDVKAAINWIENNWGEINVLVNAAAIAKSDSLTSGTGEALTEILQINVIGLATCTREVVKMMKANNIIEGHVINFNSIVGQYIPSMPVLYPYVASKHAVKVLTQSLKNELALEESPIRVTSISPGLVETEMPPGMLQMDVPRLQPSDISKCVAYVLSVPSNVNISEITIQPTGEIGARLTDRLPEVQKKQN